MKLEGCLLSFDLVSSYFVAQWETGNEHIFFLKSEAAENPF